MKILTRKTRPGQRARRRRQAHGVHGAVAVAERGDAANRLGGSRLVAAATGADGRLPTLQELEKNHIEKVLGLVNGNKTKAAEILGIGRVSLWRKIKNLIPDGLLEP